MAVFVTGATGYIGGAVASHFLEQGREVRGLVRDEQKAQQLAQKGITPVLGSLDDAELLTREARSSEGVVNGADSDHRGAVEAIVEGLAGSNKPFLHTSGTGVVAENTFGEGSDQTFQEDDLASHEGLLGERAGIDQFVLDAAKRDVRSVVLCNSCIYGWGAGLHSESIMVPWMFRQAKADGVARYIGSGTNIWSNVHIDDVVALYEKAWQKAAAGSRYLVENGEARFRDIAQAIADRLSLGAAESWSVQEAAKANGDIFAFIFGSNCRVSAQRARTELNWQPKQTSMLEWIRREG